jgi:hypothetical protein
MRGKPSLLVLLLIAGCAQDPYQRPATWHLPPEGLGANDTNLRAMVAEPADLAAGARDDASAGPLSVRPVDALMTGRRRPLSGMNASGVGGSALPGGAVQGAGEPMNPGGGVQ